PIVPWRKKSRSSIDQPGTCAWTPDTVCLVPIAFRITNKRTKKARRKKARTVTLRCIAPMYAARIQFAISNRSLGEMVDGEACDTFVTMNNAIMEEISERLERVQAQIAAAVQRSGRKPEEIELVAVSKAHPAEAVQVAVDAGQTLFGESRIQE